MNLNKILKKYKVETSHIKKHYLKLLNSKEILLLGEKYYIDYKKLEIDFNIDLLLNNNFNNTIEEAISSLNLEGIKTTKIASTKAEKITDDFLKNNRISFEIDEDLKNKNESFKKTLKPLVIKTWKKMSPNTKPSLKDFYSNVGINLAKKIIKDDNFKIGEKKSLFFFYNIITFFEEAIDDDQKIESGSFYRKGNVNITDGLNIIDKGTDGKLVNDKMIMFNDFLKNDLYNLDYNTHTIASIVKFLFIEIHPYYDANGRISRFYVKAIANKEIENEGIWAKHINQIIKLSSSAYYKSIRATRESKDLTYFLIYMNYVYNVSYFTELIISKKNEELLKIKKAITSLQSSILLYFILNEDLIKSWKDVQREVVGAKDLTEQRVKQVLNIMVEYKVLEKDKLNNLNMYKLSKTIKDEYNKQT